MKSFYFRRIERDRRTRLRVAVEDSTATIFLVSYCRKDKSDLPGTWSMEERIYDLSACDQSAEYQRLIGECECCPQSEYQSAFSEALKGNSLSRYSDNHSDFRLPQWRRRTKTAKMDYPIPATLVIQKIDDFLKAAGKRQV